jgi:hypothetical protein
MRPRGTAIVAKAEDAAELRLGEEFDHETSVSTAEVAIVLTEAMAKYEAEDRAVPGVLAFYVLGCSTHTRPFLTMAKTNGRG